jgi:anti-sigma factor RsiW
MVSCQRVLQELSNYIEGDVAPDLRAAIEEHLRGCHRCSVLVDSTRKMLYVVGDERIFEVPGGYSERLHKRLTEHMAKA